MTYRVSIRCDYTAGTTTAIVSTVVYLPNMYKKSKV